MHLKSFLCSYFPYIRSNYNLYLKFLLLPYKIYTREQSMIAKRRHELAAFASDCLTVSRL